jgi:hypothetical protein
MLKYAAESWFYHSVLQCAADGSREAAFLQQETARNDWLLVYTPDIAWKMPFDGIKEVNSGSVIYYASLLGLPVVVTDLLRSGADVNAQGGVYGSALQVASAGGRTEIAQLLLDNNVDVNAQGRHYGSALQAGSAGGHTEIVQLLVDKKADVNAQGGRYGSASRLRQLEATRR